MTRYLLRRGGQTLLALLGVSVVVFALIHLVPGDPVRIALGTRFDPETYEALRRRMGLDRPLTVQYLSWLADAVRGDLGVSFRTGRPVTELLLERLPATFTLAAAALTVALVVAVPLGILAALRHGSLVDYVATVASQIGISIPDFWSGIMYILLFSLTLGWLPPSGYVSFAEDPWGWLSHLILPACTVGLVSGSILFRFVRSAVLEAMNRDYVRTAFAKGLSRWQVTVGHVLPNAWIPIVTVVGLQLGFLLGGVVVVEVIFAWPGLGRLALLAVQDRDFTVLQGTVLYLAATFLLVNLLVDLLYARLDPRVRYD
ncbi:MAG: peptide ABC transporter permease [Acidimicrobiia bacterium]|nr:MAG: peptide ABC transporter permease [Acidimicrobiia bacterium]